jgi:hypothetical protein
MITKKIYGEPKRLFQFDKNEMTIEALPDDFMTIVYYRFRKFYLIVLSTMLWDYFKGFFDGSYEVIQLPERYTIHFETGLLLCLFRMAYPCRITKTMTYGFKMNHTKICIALKYFFDKFYHISQFLWLILIFGPIGFPTMKSWLKKKQKDLLVRVFLFY